jgi:hypothetical protein
LRALARLRLLGPSGVGRFEGSSRNDLQLSKCPVAQLTGVEDVSSRRAPRNEEQRPVAARIAVRGEPRDRLGVDEARRRVGRMNVPLAEIADPRVAPAKARDRLRRAPAGTS